MKKNIFQFVPPELLTIFMSLATLAVVFISGCNSTGKDKPYLYGGMGEFSSQNSKDQNAWDEVLAERNESISSINRNSKESEQSLSLIPSFSSKKTDLQSDNRVSQLDANQNNISKTELSQVRYDYTIRQDNSTSLPLPFPNATPAISAASVPQLPNESILPPGNLNPMATAVSSARFPEMLPGQVQNPIANSVYNTTNPVQPQPINLVRFTDENQQAEPIKAAVAAKTITWKDEAGNAIAQLRQEIEAKKKKGEPTEKEEFRLRLLYLAIDEHEKASAQCQTISEPLNKFWKDECLGLAAFLNGSEKENGMTQAVEHFEKGLASLKEKRSIAIVKSLPVEKPAPFGLYQARQKAFKKGELLHVYAELDNIVSRTTPNGDLLALECAWTLTGCDGKKVSMRKEQKCETVSASRLRDIVLNIAEEIPNNIPAGDYFLLIEAVDKNNTAIDSRCSAKVPVKVIEEK